MNFFARVVTVFSRFESVVLGMDEQRDIAREAAEYVAERARENIVAQGLVDSGHMLDTTGVREFGDGLMSVGTDAHYGEFHEYGTWKMPARPWLTPAFEESDEAFAVGLRKHFGGQ